MHRVDDLTTEPPSFLTGGGEMGALIRAYDWAATDLGPSERWPQPLRTAIRLILNTGHPMYVWWGPDLLCFYNDAYRASIGPERHPGSLARPARQVWCEIWDIIGPQIEHVMAGRGATWHENHLVPITRHGRREDVYWTYSYSPIDDETAPRGVGGVLVVCSETTEQVIAQQQAIANVERLDRMFRQAPGAVAVLRGPEHVFEIVNPAYTALVGGRDMVGKTVADALPEVAAQGFLDLLDQVYRTGEPFVGHAVPIMLSVAPKGEAAEHVLDFVYQPLTDDDGKVTGIFVQITDVSETVRAVAALRHVNATLEQRVANALAERRIMAEVMETTDAFIQVLDTDFRLLAFNKANANEYARIYGFRPRIGACLLDHVATKPDSFATAHAVWARALAGEAFTEVGEFGDASCELRTYEMTFRPLRGPDGEIIGAYQISYDITDRLRAQQQLAAAQDQLRQSQKMEAVGQLTGGVAHDFNNLLTVIRGSVDLLRRSNTTEERRRRYIDAISETVDRASRLTGQLLAFARRQALKPEVFDVAERLRGIIDMLRAVVGAGIQIVSEVATDAAYVEVDVSQFETAIVNIAVNARDAMDGAGILVIGVDVVPETPSACGQLDARQHVAVSLTDTGIGIAADKLPLIFEPFYTTKEVGKGTGLGLSQVYGFAKQSGGGVTVSSDVGHGACFTLYLPRAEHPVADDISVEADRISEQVDGAVPLRILIVEDNAEIGAFAAEILHDLGHSAVLTANAEEALEQLENGTFDVVFTDVVMPGISGIALGQTVKRMFPDLPVVLTSGYSHILTDGSHHDFDLLRKPYDAAELVDALRRNTRPRRGSRTPPG